MDRKVENFTLPLGPKGLCFDRNQFLGNNFSVDVFLHNHRNVASLETLRDDLGIYLRVLRSAMIELINRDYADFVDLSTNLIGLDKEIDNIRSPLGQLREEVLHVKTCLSEAIKELSGRLEQRRQLREKKRSLYYLGQTRASLEKLSKMMRLDKESKGSYPGDLIERASSEYVQLKFTITKCEPYIIPEQKRLYEKIEETLLATLEEMFLDCINTKRMDRVHRCLHIYSTLDRTTDAEMALRRKVVAPTLHDIISESSLQRSPTGLKGIFENILLLFDQKVKDLIAITRSSRSPIKGYNFVLNSFWPEVEYRMEVHLSSIFAPGNPELFYSRYNDSSEFLRRLRLNLETRNERVELYEHQSYKSFQQKWNLPIYFQIRFQKIAGTFESILSENIGVQCFITNDNSAEFSLKASSACWTSLTSCWADGIFIVALTHRFWKLSLQIISRYCTWINVAIKQPWPNPGNSHNNQGGKPSHEKIRFLVSLYSDVNKLLLSLPTFMEIVKTRLQPLKHVETFEKSIEDSRSSLESKIPLIKKSIILQLSSESVVHLKQINDIPRLFRKTNRDIPTKPCGYVALLMQPSMDFHSAYRSAIGDGQIVEWIESIFSIITTQYYTAVDDVLTSIQKTEDSLRRLKQIRDRPSQQNLEKAGVSDDDKIRIQLKVDVQVYRGVLTDVKCDCDKVEKLNDLSILVEKAASPKSVPTNQQVL